MQKQIRATMIFLVVLSFIKIVIVTKYIVDPEQVDNKLGLL